MADQWIGALLVLTAVGALLHALHTTRRKDQP